MGRSLIYAVLAGLALVVLFTPLAAVLLAAAKTGRGRVLARAFGGSLAAAFLWLALAYALRQAGYPLGALWCLVSAPWASALAAVWAWRSARQREKRTEAEGGRER
jgi:hypothetical protein